MNGRPQEDALVAPNSPRLRFIFALAISAALHALAILSPATEHRRPVGDDRSGWVASGKARLNVAFLPTAIEDEQASAAMQPPPESGTSRTSKLPADEGAPPLPVPGIPYFPAERLTQRPQPRTAIELDTPEIRAIPAAGRLILTLWIDPEGDVTRVETGSSELPEAFARAAAAAFGNARFIPGEIGGRAVGSILRLEVTYDDPRLLNAPAARPKMPSATGN